MQNKIAAILRITADKREIKNFPKPSLLCKLLEGKVGNEINLKTFHNESNRKGSEGWASFIRNTLGETAVKKQENKKEGGGTMRKKVEPVVTLAVVVVMSLFSVSVAQGQGLRAGAKERSGRGYFMFGGSIADIDALNSRLESKGYSKFSDNFFSLGGGGHAIINRVIIGGEGHGLIGREETSRGYKTSLSAGHGFFDLGYIVYSTGYLNVYPLLGIGGGGMSLKIVERGAPSFDEVLDDPKRSAELSTGHFLLNVALGTDYLLKLGGDDKGEGGLVFGLRVGYTFAPIKDDWEIEGTDISGGPDLGITGPYIRLMIGGGGIGKE